MASSAFLRPFESTMAKYTDAPPIFHRANALALMGSLLSRQQYRCVLHRGVAGLWTNLWVILVGDSGSDRKSFCIGAMEQVLDIVDSSLKGPDDMSPEGLAQHLFDKQQASNDPDNTSSLIIQTEFVNLLMQFSRQYSQALRPMLLKFYDVDRYQRQLRKSTFEIRRGRVSLVGGIPFEGLARNGSQEDWENGFFNRCMFVHGKKERHQAKQPQVPTIIYGNLATGLTACMARWKKANEKRDFKFFPFSEAADKVSLAVDEHLQKKSNSNYSHATMLSRSMTHFSKVAAIEQIDEDPTAKEVGKKAAERALEFIQKWQEGVPQLVDFCNTRSRVDFEGDKLAKTILRYLSKRGEQGAFQRELLYACGLNTAQVTGALTSLTDADLVQKDLTEDKEVIFRIKIPN